MSYDIDDMCAIHAEINGQIKNNVAHYIWWSCWRRLKLGIGRTVKRVFVLLGLRVNSMLVHVSAPTQC